VNESGMIRKSEGDEQYIINGHGARVALCAHLTRIKDNALFQLQRLCSAK
jgi:hypothetical protein